MKLKGKVAFITGAAQGIGRAIAEALAKEGADVVISDINIELASKAAEEIKNFAAPAGGQGVRTLAIRMNVANSSEVQASIKEAVEKFGRVDILVNNAGVTKDALLVRMKEEDWDFVLDVNLKGIFNCTKAIAPLMMKARSGKIINIASIVGQMGNVGQANYAASKAGVIGFTKTVARELSSRGICVNAIAPGFIDTEMTKKMGEDIKTKLKEQIPFGRLGLPEDVAAAAVFLSSSDSDYITGQVINVNGGMYM